MPMIPVWCETCGRPDSRWVPKGESIDSLCCTECGDKLVSTRHRRARAHFSAAIFNRCAWLTKAAAAGEAEQHDAVAYARYAAHTAFKLKLVPYGPEPRR